MALTGPIGKDNLDISFRLHSKTQVFDGSTNALANAKLNILAVASGLVFVGSAASEIYVLCMKDLELPTALDQNSPSRKVPMSSPVNQIATNCDGSILAVDVKINGIPHIQLYSVASFLSPNVQKLREFRISTDDAVSSQLCWNPVINSVLAVCTETGGLNLYALKDQGVEFHSIDPSLKANCCCWSPKGKQIVAGFSNGKLMQFNMELKPARTIECPTGIFPGGSFDTIAVQWLSTYQFAIALLSHQRESRPVLHILNAPKAGPLQYIAYNDVCYSTSEVRPSKMYIQYIQQWGMLLIASANCVDVSFLRISKPGDIPEWIQEFPNDQFPAELPLTPDKEESFPIGFELDIACSGRLLQEDGSPYPVMPMIHLLSTYGVMCSFYLLNTTQTFVDICSPPRPIDPRIVQSLFTVNIAKPSSVAAIVPKEDFKTPSKPILSAPISQSTPAVTVQPKINLFGTPTTTTTNQASLPLQQNAFTGFSLSGQTPPSFQQQQPKPAIGQVNPTPTNIQPFQINTSKPPPPITTNATVATVIPRNEPLITVPPVYNPSTTTQSKSETRETSAEKINDKEDEQVYIKMIHDEMKAFELELNFIMKKSKSLSVSIGTKDESAEMRRKIEELDELKKEATETIESLRSDVQTNRLGLTELFSMLYEAKAKCDQANEKSIIMTHTQDRTSKRTLDNLKRMINQCDMQIQVCIQLLASQWSNYQDTLNKSKKNKMHIPSLEGVYQTLSKQQEIIYNLNGKLKMMKTKLGIYDDVKKQKNANMNATMESLSDSIISMSLVDQVQNEKSKLTEKKLKDLRNYLEGRAVVTIKPKRPLLPGLNSEIIIEKKIKAMKNLKRPDAKKEVAKALPQKVENIQPKQPSETVFNLQKASPFTSMNASTPSQLSFAKKPIEPQSQQPQSKPFSFGNLSQQQSSPFGINSNTQQQQPFALNLSSSAVSSQPSFGFNQSTTSSQPSFGFSSPAMVLSAEKKKEDFVVVPSISKTQTPKLAESKPASTISNANISVSANFSVSLPKASPAVTKEAPKVEEKKHEVPKSIVQQPPTTNESASFTFSLPGKKEVAAASKPVQGISFGNTTTATSDTVKNAFSFGSSSASPGSFSFAAASKSIETKAPAVATSSASIFSGFGSNSAAATTTPSSTSIFGGSASSPFVLNLSDSNKSASVFGSVSSTTPKISEETKTATVTSSSSPLTPPNSNSTIAAAPSIFGSSSEPKTSTSFSFANFGASIAATSSQPTAVATTAVSIFGGKSNISTTSTAPSSVTSTTDSVLSNLTICSPDVTKPTENSKSTPSNLFGNSTAFKSDSSSIFGSGFGSTFGASSVATTKTPILGTSPSISTVAPTLSSSSPAIASTQVSSPSIFSGQATSPTTTTTAASTGSSLFGALTLDANKATSPPSTTAVASTNIFGGSNLVKPDQSVFGQPATTSSSSSPSTFGNIFSAAAKTTQANIFSSASSPAVATTSSSIFGSTQSSTTSNIFAAASPATTQPSNIFAQSQPQSSIFATAAAATTQQPASGSLFTANSFTSPTTNSGSIFGGSSTAQTQSPFGSTNVFGSGGQQQQQQSSSVFGNSSFGNASANTNIFGGSTAAATAPQTQTTSPFGSSSVFGGSQPTFGGTASFSNAFGQSTFGSGSIFSQQQQNQPTFGGSATFGSPKATNIFGSTATTPPSSGGSTNIFEQLGQQQTGGNLFGNLATQQQQQPQPQQQGPGFSGSAFSSWR